MDEEYKRTVILLMDGYVTMLKVATKKEYLDLVYGPKGSYKWLVINEYPEDTDPQQILSDFRLYKKCFRGKAKAYYLD